MIQLLFIMFLLLVGAGCNEPLGARWSAKTLDVTAFPKIPLRLAVIIPPRDEDWLGRKFFMSEDLFGRTSYFIRTPLKCYRERTKKFLQMRLFIKNLRIEADETFRRNLPLFFEHVEVLEAIPRNPEGYDLLIHPKVLRWPEATDSPNRVEVKYRLTFQTPLGRLLLDRIVRATAEAVDYDLSRPMKCEATPLSEFSEVWIEYRRAVAEAQAKILANFFSNQDTADTIRAYAGQVVAERKERQTYARLALTEKGLSEQLRDLVHELLSQLPPFPARTIAVTTFEPIIGTSTQFNAYLAEELVSRLAETDTHAVVERALLEKALDELRFSRTDLVDPRHARQFGQMTGADTVLVGSTAELDYWITIAARLVDTETGTLLAAGSREVFKHKEVRKLLNRKLTPVEESSEP